MEMSMKELRAHTITGDIYQAVAAGMDYHAIARMAANRNKDGLLSEKELSWLLADVYDEAREARKGAQ